MKSMLRRIGLPILKRFQKDINIQHHWVANRRLLLNSFLHKGYWYFGKKREAKSMLLFSKLIGKGMTIAEIGGHIGYLSVYFSSLVGPSGRVIVFEPGSNNLPYIKSNLLGLENIILVEKGIGAENEELMFFEDSLTGQNNSFVENFEGLRANANIAFTTVSVKNRKVEVVKLDSYFLDSCPDFIKIDIEGYEYSALRGASNLLKKLPIVMVEVQANAVEIFEVFDSLGYVIFDENGVKVEQSSNLVGNMFCLHTKKHATALKELHVEN
jgi:FkbM family methyltransferase